MTRLVRAVVVSVICWQVANVQAGAEDPNPKTDESIQNLATGDKATVERIMDTAVNNIARRYNLSQKQTDKTREIMYREVTRFLRDHEDQVWPLIRDFLSQKGLGQPPNDVEEMKRIGKAAGPMMELIQEAIIRGNQEWRRYLTEEQKVMHDYDMAEIDHTFEKIDENLDRWAQGDTGAGGVFPPPPPPNAGPAQPPRPPDDEELKAEIVTFEPKRLFDAFVENFIKQYRLDESQIDAARSILAEYKSKAVDFKNAKKSELRVIGAKWLAAQEAGNRKLLLEAEAEQKELLAPVHALLGEMQDRLTSLLTTSQKQRYAAATKKPPRAKKEEPNQADKPKPQEQKDEPEAKKASAPEPPEPSSDAGGD